MLHTTTTHLPPRSPASAFTFSGTAVKERYGRGSTMITSQLPVKAWHDVIGEPTFADAILDRIVHNAYRLELEGQSMRKTITKMSDETPQN